MRFIPGLVSISFRALSVGDIIGITTCAGLEAVEWGSDVHVPAGDIAAAEAAKKKTVAAGLSMPEYGSYYVLGSGEDIEKTVTSARILGITNVRIWAGNMSASEMSPEVYAKVVDDAKSICGRYPDIMFCLECHNRTVTQEYTDELKFFCDVGRKNLMTLWQPNQLRTHSWNMESVRALLPYIYGVHVFSWEGKNMLPLDAHTDRWAEYLSILRGSERETMPLMLEFMHDNRPESLPETAQTLKKWIKAAE